jgi:hypothetical protein
MMRVTRASAAIPAVLAMAFAATALADNFDLSWYTIDGGGGMFSTGGSFALGGTIGQPDAGVMTGGSFELVGGFWALPAAGEPCAGQVRGDSNCDGGVDFDDIDCFVASLIGQDSWNACGHGEGCDYACVNDINQDGSVDFDDIDKFVECLINGGCP